MISIEIKIYMVRLQRKGKKEGEDLRESGRIKVDWYEGTISLFGTHLKEYARSVKSLPQ